MSQYILEDIFQVVFSKVKLRLILQATYVGKMNFGFVLYVLGYTIGNGLHCDILVKGIPIKEPLDVCLQCCQWSYLSITSY